DRHGPQFGALCEPAAGGRADPGPLARTGGNPPPLRLSSAARAAGPRRPSAQSQEAEAALPRGTAAGPPAWRSQASARYAGADGAAAGAEPALVARLRVGHADRRPALPHPGDSRRLLARMPVPGRRHVALRGARGPRTR